jgi:uncharacterized protein (TIGR00369 family)
VVDERRLRRLLQRIADDLAWLAERRAGDRATLRADADRLAALKYRFVTAIGGCINVAQHLCASEGCERGSGSLPAPTRGGGEGTGVLERHSGLERLREVAREVHPSPVMRLTGMRILDVADGEITCGMPASGWLTNYGGTIYGGAIALLAEATASAAVLSTLPPATACSPLDLKVNFVRPVKPSREEITSHGRVVHRGRTIAIVHCELSAEGKLVAIANQSVLVLPGRSWDEPVHVADEIASDAGAT